MKVTRIRLCRQFQPFHDGPGLGIAVREAEFGKPIFETAA